MIAACGVKVGIHMRNIVFVFVLRGWTCEAAVLSCNAFHVVEHDMVDLHIVASECGTREVD